MTPDDISKLRQAARQLKRTTGITHYQALNQQARAAGFPSWASQMAAATGSMIPTPKNPSITETAARAPATALAYPKSWTDVFHAVRIEGMAFRARITDEGPFLEGVAGDIRNAWWWGQVQLGVCQLAHFSEAEARQWRVAAPGWWITKYSSGETRIDVRVLSAAGRTTLTQEFGLPSWPTPTTSLGDHFFESPAFAGLVEWVNAHPRLARRLAQGRSEYVRGWYARAQAARDAR